MKLGLVTPVVLLVPRVSNAWEADASVDDVVAIAQAAERLGFRHLTASEHVGIPVAEEGRRGLRYWDGLSTLSFLAGVTERVRLTTHVVVLGYHHPLEIVKRYGTLDLLSGGRLDLGVGVGSLREEFELLGASFDDRGARADDALRAIRASFGEEVPSYHGAYHDFGGFRIDPLPRQARIPIWVGGRSRRSLVRAVELGDGWMPFGLSTGTLRDLIDEQRHRGAMPPGFDLVLDSGRALDPRADPDGTRRIVQQFHELGATVLNVRLRHGSREECMQQMEAVMEIAHEVGGTT